MTRPAAGEYDAQPRLRVHPLASDDRRRPGDEILGHDLPALVGQRLPSHRVAQRASEVDVEDAPDRDARSVIEGDDRTRYVELTPNSEPWARREGRDRTVEAPLDLLRCVRRCRGS